MNKQDLHFIGVKAMCFTKEKHRWMWRDDGRFECTNCKIILKKEEIEFLNNNYVALFNDFDVPLFGAFWELAKNVVRLRKYKVKTPFPFSIKFKDDFMFIAGLRVYKKKFREMLFESFDSEGFLCITVTCED